MLAGYSGQKEFEVQPKESGKESPFFKRIERGIKQLNDNFGTKKLVVQRASQESRSFAPRAVPLQNTSRQTDQHQVVVASNVNQNGQTKQEPLPRETPCQKENEEISRKVSAIKSQSSLI